MAANDPLRRELMCMVTNLPFQAGPWGWPRLYDG
jgi:hypothetical protein